MFRKTEANFLYALSLALLISMLQFQSKGICFMVAVTCLQCLVFIYEVYGI